MRDRIVKDREWNRSRKPRNIILCPLFNLISEKTMFDSAYLRSSYKLTWNYVQNYFYHQQQMKSLPMHVYEEYLDEDYVFYLGCPSNKNSWFIEKLVQARVLNSQYRDDILVVLNGDYRESPPDFRMLEGLSHFVLAPLMEQYNLSKEHVLFIDDILLDDFETRTRELKKKPNSFKLEKCRYWDHNQLILALKDQIRM
jgi:hypothetical protein